MGHIDAPKIIHLQLIDPHRLEIYWDQEVIHTDLTSCYKIFKTGTELDFFSNRGEDVEWDVRPVYEQVKKRTTLYLKEPITKKDLQQINVSVCGEIKNSEGTPADKNRCYTVCHWHDFYNLYTRSETGIIVKSSDNVSREAHRTAVKIIDVQLAKIPEVAKVMEAMHVEVAIYGKNEDVYDLPEHRGGADLMDRPVEGFGGIPDNPVTSIAEKNVLRIIDGPNQTRYLNECILAHEFGHAIHLIGINNLPDQTLANELIATYEHAKAENLWPNTYAISNYEEYFATLSTIWFNVMAASKSGIWDGVRGPIHRREQLAAYDPAAYQFFAKIYEKTNLPAPWNEPILSN
jgi:hypothetical protein